MTTDSVVSGAIAGDELMVNWHAGPAMMAAQIVKPAAEPQLDHLHCRRCSGGLGCLTATAER